MPDRPHSDLTPKQRKLVLAYRDRTLTVKQLLTACDATRRELDVALAKAKEPFRQPTRAKPGRVARRRTPLSTSRLLGIVPDPSGRAADEPLGRRLERLLAARVADMENLVSPGRDADPEATAKALALNVRTLAALRRVAAGPDDDAPADATDPPPRSLAQLRDELRDQLWRLRQEERSRPRAPTDESHAD